jgi:homoserine dehydrogenase
VKLSVIGAGDVGTAVVELANDYDHTVTAFADSTSAVLSDDGIDSEAIIVKKRAKEPLGKSDPSSALSADYDVLIEATPTTLDDAEPAFSHVQEALERDRHVVLSNKDPMALRYQEVRGLEQESAGSVRFGATIGGTLPAIGTLEDIGKSHVTSINGALDGMANFILSRMTAEGLDYDHVLAEAQDLGVAESDPSFKAEGTDSAMKALILANLLWEDQEYTLVDVTVDGISDLTGSQLDLAREDGWTIRLMVELSESSVRVGPRLIREHSFLAPSGSFTAIEFETEHAGPISFTGRGTGGIETATMILSDVNKLPPN